MSSCLRCRAPHSHWGQYALPSRPHPLPVLPQVSKEPHTATGSGALCCPVRSRPHPLPMLFQVSEVAKLILWKFEVGCRCIPLATYCCEAERLCSELALLALCFASHS